MGGGTSRLDETDWTVADGGLDGQSLLQTIDGALPTSKYELYEIQKRTVGQREFDVIDSEQNLRYTTRAVPGTVSWFDVLGPGSCGDYNDCKLRVQADYARRTWIVYRYHLPLFEGQKPAPPDEVKNVQEGVLLYRTACITVSWSRYIAVAARYGPPNMQDFLDWAMEEAEIENAALDDDKNGSSNDDDDGELNQQQLQQENTEIEVELLPNDVAAGNEDPTSTGERLTEAEPTEEEKDKTDAPEINGDGNDQSLSPVGQHDDATPPATGSDTVSPESDPVEEEKLATELTDTAVASPSEANDENADNVNDTEQQQPAIATPTLTTSITATTTTAPAIDASTIKDPSGSVTLSRKSATAGTTVRKVTLPATTLTTSLSSVVAASSRSQRSNARKTRLRDYFINKSSSSSPSAAIAATAATSPSGGLGASRFFTSKKTPPTGSGGGEDGTVGDVNDDGRHGGDDDDVTDTGPTKPTAESLYELALGGVIDLDNQPILQCQEIYNKMIGNHQTFLMTKEQVIKLLQMDQAQHEKDLAKDGGLEGGTATTGTKGSTTTDSSVGGDTVNPMVQAIEIDATHDHHKSDGSSPSRRSKWFSRLSNLRSKESSPTAGTPASDETGANNQDQQEPVDALVTAASSSSSTEPANEMEASIQEIVRKKKNATKANNGNSSRRLGSKLNRFFSSKDVNTSDNDNNSNSNKNDIEEPPACVVLEEYGQDASLQTLAPTPTGDETQELTEGDRNVMITTDNDVAENPPLEDEGKSPVATPPGVSTDEDDIPSLVDGPSSSTDQEPPSTETTTPGNGVEESKEDIPYEEDVAPSNTVIGDGTDDKAEDKIAESSASSTADAAATDEKTDAETVAPTPNNKTAADDLPPLVGYWMWKHNSFNFQQHKMFLHLAKNSDLALHLVLAIIVNQVRSERNHTIFATTGLHPAWFFIDPKNPKAMIN